MPSSANTTNQPMPAAYAIPSAVKNEESHRHWACDQINSEHGQVAFWPFALPRCDFLSAWDRPTDFPKRDPSTFSSDSLKPGFNAASSSEELRFRHGKAA